MSADILLQDIQYLKGVGPNRAKVLNDELQVRTLLDLLECYPVKYIDRTKVYAISEIKENMPYVQLKGRIIAYQEEGEGYKRRLKASFYDGTGYVTLVWFNGLRYVRKNYPEGRDYVLLGRPGFFNGNVSFAHPELDDVRVLTDGRSLALQPHYRITEKMKRHGINTQFLRGMMESALQLVKGQIKETLPDFVVHSNQLLSREDAMRFVHFPESSVQVSQATKRLKFEELFFLQLMVLRYAQSRKVTTGGFIFARIGKCFLDFYRSQLPFELTEAQKRVIREIRVDVGSGRQMNRLLQGDVGSGKTMVAFMTCLMAVDNGFQACVMAPTEILAEQHYQSFRRFIGNLPVSVELLTGVIKGKRRKEVMSGLADGSIHILVGTHAVIEPDVMFSNLGLAVIDEQHRFGVKQRAKLWGKNRKPPHVLIMTATPIPRTLAMTVYGDLDVSVIDQLPPGRKPIKTIHYYRQHINRLYDGIRHELQQGRQVYVVYPLIEENEKMDLKNLEEGYAFWSEEFSPYKVGKLHGKMSPKEKEQVMDDFKERRTQILVSTTVIEVGVNVPNASVMVIEEAQRFGLAQLHQLRGRVGRGSEQSYCILVTNYNLSETTRKRMQIMVDTTDGFVIAEEDLKLRGPGDIEGTAQSGLPMDLKVANLTKDAPMMEEARKAAQTVLEMDLSGRSPQLQPMWNRLAQLCKHTINFSAIS